jgi:hypothetical protein
MKRHHLILAGIATTLLCAVAIAGASAAGTPNCRPQPASAVPPPLTNAQCVEAQQILARDTHVQRLLAGVRATVERPDPWGGNGDRDIGAVFRIHLLDKLYVKQTSIPVADFPSDGSDAYRALHQTVSINGATGLTVFVDLRSRRVVWVMPTPTGSEGPPPTSIPPYTLPSGFVEGTGGATPADASAGLVARLVAFDSTGRLAQQEWFDPVTGKAVTDFYDATGKLTGSMASSIDGTTVHVTSVSYLLRTWTSGSGTLPIGGTQLLAADSRTLPARLQNGGGLGLANAGSGTADGIAAVDLRGPVAIPYWGLLFLGGEGDVWVDPTTYLPIELESSGAKGVAGMKVVFSWLPRGAGTASETTLAVPAGYKHTPSKGLPNIFGD